MQAGAGGGILRTTREGMNISLESGLHTLCRCVPCIGTSISA